MHGAWNHCNATTDKAGKPPGLPVVGGRRLRRNYFTTDLGNAAGRRCGRYCVELLFCSRNDVRVMLDQLAEQRLQLLGHGCTGGLRQAAKATGLGSKARRPSVRFTVSAGQLLVCVIRA